MPGSKSVRVGTSGWSYPSGQGTWNGIFYPKPRPRGFDELRFYAERFDTVEINSTFYGQPRATVSEQWVERTPEGFEFAVKLYQKFTHPKLARDTSPVNATDIDAFKAGIEPLASAGRLGPLLAQFPASFKQSGQALDYLSLLLRTFSDHQLAIELRHRSWSDSAESLLALLAEHDAAWTQIDEPKFRDSVAQDLRPNVGSLFYLRLHGRNAQQWWQHAKSEDRYNYLYSEEELAPLADTTRRAGELAKKRYLYLNNHFAAQAVADAAVLRHMLDDPVEASMPREMVTRYPMLNGKVRT